MTEPDEPQNNDEIGQPESQPDNQLPTEQPTNAQEQQYQQQGQNQEQPYQQQPYEQPYQPYQQQPYEQQGQYQQQGQNQEQQYQQQPYEQQYQQYQYQQYQQQGQPYYGYPYPPQQPYPAAPEQPKRRIWPWVLCICLIAFLIVIGVCVGVVACSVLNYVDENGVIYYDDNYSDTIPGITEEDPYGYNGTNEAYSLQEIEEQWSELSGTATNNRCEPGVYVVGDDIAAGLYFVEGSPDELGYYYLYEQSGSDAYELSLAIEYVGNYLAQLNDGDVLVFNPYEKSSLMYPADEASFNPTAPYQCGLYRVGTDIPAGTYTISLQEEAAKNIDDDCAAYIMSDLDFNDESITDTLYVIAGSSHTVTVHDGEYLELFGTVATPEE